MFILFNSILSSFFEGLLLSFILILICFLLPKGVHIRPNYSVGSFIVLLFAFFFFLFQSTLLIGGFKAKRYTNDAHVLIETITNEKVDNINSEKWETVINWYIVRRFCWLAGGLIITGGLMWKLTAENQRRNNSRSRRQYPTHYSSKRHYK